MKRFRWPIASAVGVTLTVAVIAGTLYSTVGASGSQPPPSTPPPPASTPAPREPMALDEERQARQEEARKTSGQTVVVSGPRTKGSIITVAEVDVQMPSDAFVSRYIVEVFCVPSGSCPEVPIYELRRGNSTIAVSAGPGIVVEEDIAPGEEGAFDFLKEVLP